MYSCPLNAISDASLCILCMAFLQNLYFARVSHGMVQFVLKMAHLSILMEPTMLLEKASATVSYNAFGWCWYLNVACMLAAQVARTESYVYVVEQAQRFRLEHQQQTEKKTYNSLSSDRSEKIPGGSCSILLVCITLQE